MFKTKNHCIHLTINNIGYSFNGRGNEKNSSDFLDSRALHASMLLKWNALPHIDLSLSLSTIKFHLKNFLWSHFLEHFDSFNPCTFHFVCPCSNCHFTTPAPSQLSHWFLFLPFSVGLSHQVTPAPLPCLYMDKCYGKLGHLGSRQFPVRR